MNAGAPCGSFKIFTLNIDPKTLLGSLPRELMGHRRNPPVAILTSLIRFHHEEMEIEPTVQQRKLNPTDQMFARKIYTHLRVVRVAGPKARSRFVGVGMCAPSVTTGYLLL